MTIGPMVAFNLLDTYASANPASKNLLAWHAGAIFGALSEMWDVRVREASQACGGGGGTVTREEGLMGCGVGEHGDKE